jgi:hypothetical protein
MSTFGQLASFVGYMTLQIAFARFMVLDHTAFCFVYVAFLLLLPRQQWGEMRLLLMAFAVGVLIDVFYHSPGLHSFAAVLMVYSRKFLLTFMLPANDYEVATQPTLDNLGWKKFSLFALVLIAIHHTALFLLDAGSPPLFFIAMRKAIFSTLLTYTAVIIVQSFTLLARKK